MLSALLEASRLDIYQVDGETVAVEVIQGIQCTEASVITKLIDHKSMDHIVFGASGTARASGVACSYSYALIIGMNTP